MQYTCSPCSTDNQCKLKLVCTQSLMHRQLGMGGVIPSSGIQVNLLTISINAPVLRSSPRADLPPTTAAWRATNSSGYSRNAAVFGMIHCRHSTLSIIHIFHTIHNPPRSVCGCNWSQCTTQQRTVRMNHPMVMAVGVSQKISFRVPCPVTPTAPIQSYRPKDGT